MEIEDDTGGPDPSLSLSNGNETTTVSTAELPGILCLKLYFSQTIHICISGDKTPLPCDDDNTEDQSIPSIVIENVDEEENTEDQSIPSFQVPDELNDSLLSLLSNKNFDISIQSEQSIHSSDSEVEDEPEIIFEVTEREVTTGSRKGEIVKKIVLRIGNHTFKRRRQMKNGNLQFTCNGCERAGHYTSAVVGVEESDKSEKYYLIRAPRYDDHPCWVTDNEAIKRAKDEMCSIVLNDPTRSLQEIYEEVRNRCTEDMDANAKLLFLQDFPTWIEIKTILVRKRREVIPSDPKVMTDIDLSLPVFLLKDGESVVKGDEALSDGRRIILFTTKEHLKILARAHQILGDGTFRITPRLWTQTFIISAEVSKDVFVPVCFSLLPDKKKESYVCMFSLLKKALEAESLELSAEYFMSDFEVAIRDSFLSTFQGVEAKGCAFHFAKAILSKVSKSGFKRDYQQCPDFSAFIRATLGLAYVPLARLTEAVRNLYILAKKLTDRQVSFAVSFLKYIERSWINGSFHPKSPAEEGPDWAEIVCESQQHRRGRTESDQHCFEDARGEQ